MMTQIETFIKMTIGAAKLLYLFMYILYTILRIILNETIEMLAPIYEYVFGSNHTNALIVFATIAIICLTFLDKLLNTETNIQIFKSHQKQIRELEDEILSLKEKHRAISEDLFLTHMRFSKDIELFDLKRDMRINTLTKHIKKLERQIKQYN
jgi:uncharacterized membrane protein (DUF106 family)